MKRPAVAAPDLDIPDNLDLDPNDPVQGFAELASLETQELAVDALDHAVPYVDDEHGAANGDSWMEALAAEAGENGPEPEHQLPITEDDDLPPAYRADRPVADSGSGGPRGL